MPLEVALAPTSSNLILLVYTCLLTDTSESKPTIHLAQWKLGHIECIHEDSQYFHKHSGE